LSEKSLTRRALASRGTRAALSLVTSVGLLLGPGGIVAVAPVAASNASSASLDQCANGAPSGSRQACTGSNWQNGNINSNNSQYREGDSVPFRALITVPTNTTGSATTHTIWVQYDSTVSGKHAYDYLTTWNRTETGDPTSGTTVNSTPVSTGAIPPPIDLQPSTCSLATAQVTTSPGDMTLYGPAGSAIVANGVTYTAAPSGTAEPTNCQGTSNSVTVQVVFTVPANNSGTANLILAWGGHIGTQQSWGTGNSAVAISGSPYHERILQIDATSLGNQDRSLKASAVLVPPTIVTQVSPGGSDPSVAIGTSVTDLATVSGSAGTPTGSVTFFLCTGPCASSSTGGTQIGLAVTLNNLGQATSSPAVNTPTAPLTPGEYCFRVSYAPGTNSQYTPGTETNSTTECFTVGGGTTTTATSVWDETSSSAVASGGTITLGDSVHDTSTVTPSPAGFTPTGSVAYTFFPNGLCTAGTGTSAGGGALVAGVAPNSNTESSLAAGTYAFQAVFTSGDSNYTGSTSPCEPFTVPAPPTGLIAPTNTTCQEYLATPSAYVLGAIHYSVTGANKIGGNINPGVFFYFSTVTVTAGQTVTTSQEDGGGGLFLLNQGHASAYDLNCNKVATGTPTDGGATASFTFAQAGTYVLQLQYSTKSLAGNAAPSTSSVTYGFDTNGYPADNAYVNLVTP
jgi:hypothetical protein